MLKGKKILLGVSSGISIYKVLDLVSRLRKKGAEVTVIMTEAATKFINPITFETMSDNKVYTDLWQHPGMVLHVDITKDKDLFLIAPATANTIAKVHAGIADNLLTSTILASSCPVVFVPAMNTNMLLNPITQRNIGELKYLGYDFLACSSGHLACNTVGPGRMPEPVEIIDYIYRFFYPKDLKGKKIIVTAGATMARIDPVRFLTNDSSGKMGFNLARQARNRGAEVVYITGRVKTPDLDGVKRVEVVSNEDMRDAIDADFDDADALIMAAAPVDYQYKDQHHNKLKKEDADKINFEFVEAIDILKTFGEKKKDQVLIGFAAETEKLIENAKSKLEKKKADFIVANDVSKEGAGFNSDTNIITILGKDDYMSEHPKLEKYKVADIILDLLR